MRPLLCVLLLTAAACSSPKPTAVPDAGQPSTAATTSPAPTSASPAAPPASLTAQGELTGKPLTPRFASAVIGAKNVASVTLRESGAGCGPSTAGAREIHLEIPWQEGTSIDTAEKVDLAEGTTTLPVMTPRAMLADLNAAGQLHLVFSLTFKGTARVLASPRAVGQVGRLSLDMTSGTYSLRGEIPVQVCDVIAKH